PHDRGEGLEILKTVELAGAEFARGERGLYHHFDDGGREPLDLVHGGEQLAGERSEERGRRAPKTRKRLRQSTRHDLVALARRSERLDHVAEVGGMQIAEEADEAPVGKARKQHVGARGLGNRALRLRRASVLVAGLEIFSVELKVRRVLAGEHRVRLGPGGDEYGVRRQPVLRGFAAESAFPSEADSACRAVVVHVHRYRRQPSTEGDPFLARLLDLLVI